MNTGCPVQLSPEFDDRNIAADPSRTNDFDFDSPGSANVDFRCPMAAHIRKTNPRNDLGSRGPNGTVNRFRILRRGIPYVRKGSKQISDLCNLKLTLTNTGQRTRRRPQRYPRPALRLLSKHHQQRVCLHSGPVGQREELRQARRWSRCCPGPAEQGRASEHHWHVSARCEKAGQVECCQSVCRA